MTESELLKNIEKKLNALIILTTHYNTPVPERSDKVEVALDRIGIDRSEIALFLGKNKSAIDKSIQRSKK